MKVVQPSVPNFVRLAATWPASCSKTVRDLHPKTVADLFAAERGQLEENRSVS